MSSFEGKLCLRCMTRLSAGDEVVLCDTCRMPQHKACWDKHQGCGVIGCKSNSYSIARAEVGQSTTAPSAPFSQPYFTPPQTSQPGFRQFAVQSELGMYNDATGASTMPWEKAPEQHTEQESVTVGEDQEPYHSSGVEELIADNRGISQNEYDLIGSRTTYYEKIFVRLSRARSSASWNWAALLFGPLWLLYRRLYLFGFALVLYALAVLYFQLPYMLLLVLPVFHLFFALYGNACYRRRISRFAKRLKSKTDKSRVNYVFWHGNTNAYVVLLTIIGILLLHYCDFI